MTKAVIIGQIGSDGLQGVLLAAEHVEQYQQIMDNDDLLPEERVKQLMELFRSAAIAGTLTYISVKGSRADLDNLNHNRSLLNKADVENPQTVIDLDADLEHSVPIHEQQTRAETRTQIEPETRQLDEGLSPAKKRLMEVIEHKFVNPDTFEEADKLLNLNRVLLEQGKYAHKYSLEEMELLLENPVIKDKYVTRIMNTDYLDNTRTKEVRAGYLGAPLEWKPVLDEHGKPKLDDNGREVMQPARGKLWSAGFDQTERGDKCPEQQAAMAGVNREVNAKTGEFDNQTLILIDKEKYAAMTGSEFFRPTWENMIDLSVRFAKDIKGTEAERIARIRKVMNTKFQDSYAVVFKEAKKRHLDIWDVDSRNDLLNLLIGHDAEKMLQWNDRFIIHQALGANEHFLGTGYTKNLISGLNKNAPGIAEIFIVENKLLTIKELEEASVIKVYDIITPVKP